MVGEAKEGALHGPVVLWRRAGWPNQPAHLAEKHHGNQHSGNGQLGNQHFDNQPPHLAEKHLGNQHFGKQSPHLLPLPGEEHVEVVEKEEGGSAEDEEWKENWFDMEDFDLGRDSEGERKRGKVEIKGDVKEEDEEGNFEDSESDGDFQEAKGVGDSGGDGRVLFAGHFEEGGPQGI